MCFVGYNHSHVLKVCADQGICTEHEDIPEHCDASKFISTALECLAGCWGVDWKLPTAEGRGWVSLLYKVPEYDFGELIVEYFAASRTRENKCQDEIKISGKLLCH